jgi:YfhE-like protein
VKEMADKRKREKTRNSLSGAQEVTYSRAFKMADRAGGYINSKSSH